MKGLFSIREAETTRYSPCLLDFFPFFLLHTQISHVLLISTALALYTLLYCWQPLQDTNVNWGGPCRRVNIYVSQALSFLQLNSRASFRTWIFTPRWYYWTGEGVGLVGRERGVSFSPICPTDDADTRSTIASSILTRPPRILFVWSF